MGPNAIHVGSKGMNEEQYSDRETVCAMLEWNRNIILVIPEMLKLRQSRLHNVKTDTPVKHDTSCRRS